LVIYKESLYDAWSTKYKKLWICLHPLVKRCGHLSDRSNELSTSLYFCTESENRSSFRDVTSCLENCTVGPASP